MIKHNELFSEHTTRVKIRQLLSQYKHGNMLTNTKNSKTNEPNKFILYLTKRLDSRSSNKHATLQNLSVY